MLGSEEKDLASKSNGGRPFGLRWRSSKWFILSTVCYAVFTDIFLYSLIIPVIPFALTQRVQIAQEDVSRWVSVLIAIFGGSLAATSPFFGWVADHTKTRQAPFIVGLLCLTGGTLMLHLGRKIPILVIGRLIQGASASVVWIVGLALLADTVPAEEIGQSMGYIFIAVSLGTLLGPLLGGIVFDRTSYDAVFGIAYAIIGVDVILRLLVIEKKTAAKWLAHPESLELSSPGIEKQDPMGVSTMKTAIEKDQVTSEEAKVPMQKTRPPMITLLQSKRLLSSLWGTVAVALLTTAFEATLPLYTQEIWSWTSTGAALLFVALVVPSFLGPVVGAMADKVGARWLAASGFAIIVPVEVCLRFVDYDSIGQKVLLVALLVIFGFSLNLVMTPIMADITYIVQAKVDKNPAIFGKRSAYAQAYGLFNLAYAVGSLIGPIWGGFIRTSAGWGTMGWTLGLVSGVTVIPTVIWCGGAIYKK